jgi:hypothetical protein
MAIKLGAAKEGGVFAAFELEGCAWEFLNGAKTFNGSVTAIPDGATPNFFHAEITAHKSLSFGSFPVGIEANTTLSGRASSAEAYTPLSFTTVETP